MPIAAAVLATIVGCSGGASDIEPLPTASPARFLGGVDAPPEITPKPDPTVKPLSIKRVSVTTPVRPGATARVIVKTSPKARCGIDVSYNSGSSTAAGLGNKTADGSGRVSWSWTIGTRTASGQYPIDVYCQKGDAYGQLALIFKVT